MMNTNRAIIAGNVPLRLTAEQMENPMAVLSNFFGAIDLEEARDIMWFFFSIVICMDDEDIDEYDRRAIRLYYEEIELLIEASYEIYKKAQKLTR